MYGRNDGVRLRPPDGGVQELVREYKWSGRTFKTLREGWVVDTLERRVYLRDDVYEELRSVSSLMLRTYEERWGEKGREEKVWK